MSFEPQKFFVGLIDFFSIFMPGALLTYVVKDDLGPVFLGAHGPTNETQNWLIFVFCSYLLGHFIFLIGSWLDEIYDMARKATQNHRLKELAKRNCLRPKWQRFLLWLVFKREQDWAVERATAIKKLYLNPLQASRAVNTFQWAKLHLTQERPEILAVVQRFEADSKFFRSFVVVLLLIPVYLALLAHGRMHAFVLLAVILLPLAFWRYMEQRHKASSYAYWAVVTLEGRARTVIPKSNEASATASTHAGGVVYRRRGKGRFEYLLVEASRTRNEWVLPKGHIEADEDSRLTAVREVREETGVLGRIDADLEQWSYEFKGEAVRVHFYLMYALEQWRPTDPLRDHQWLPFEQAVIKIEPAQNKEIVIKAESLRISHLGDGAA